MTCLRVVIDTNIIVSALIFGGKVSRLRLAWQDDFVTGDRYLLTLKDNFSCPIVTAEEFINVIDNLIDKR